jgi:hypothetical protein
VQKYEDLEKFLVNGAGAGSEAVVGIEEKKEVKAGAKKYCT